MERGTRFELAHPRVEALVHSLYYVTPAILSTRFLLLEQNYSIKKNIKVNF